MQLFFVRLCLDQAGSATRSYIGVVRAMGLFIGINLKWLSPLLNGLLQNSLFNDERVSSVEICSQK